MILSLSILDINFLLILVVKKEQFLFRKRRN